MFGCQLADDERRIGDADRHDDDGKRLAVGRHDRNDP